MQTTFIAVQSPARGISPSGFERIHVEMSPRAVGHLIGYDPRTLTSKPRGKKKVDTTPHNISSRIVEMAKAVQRAIDPDRIEAMVEYLRGAFRGDYADWDAISVVTSTPPNWERLAVDGTVLFDSEADYFVADGQHRYAALLDFCRKYPELADRFTQAVTVLVLPADKLDAWAAQSFHDRNYYATPVKAGKALSTDSRDTLNALAKEMGQHPSIVRAGGVAYDRDTLLKGDARLLSHSVLHRFVRGFIFGRSGLDATREEYDSATVFAAKDDLRLYISQLGVYMPWTGENRDELLSRASVVFSALSVIGHDIYTQYGEAGEREAVVAKLKKLNWSRANLATWEGVAGSAKDGKVQPASNRPAIDAVIRYLREYLGLAKQAVAA